jgi:hypothetical protein
MTSDNSVMIDPEQQRLVLVAIINGPRPRRTLRVWGLAMVHIQRDTGEITASCRELAEDGAEGPSVRKSTLSVTAREHKSPGPRTSAFSRPDWLRTSGRSGPHYLRMGPDYLRTAR